MNRKQKIIVSITGIFIVLLALVGLTYAYFLTRIRGNEKDKSISVTTANLELVYGNDDGSIIGDGELIEPDKTFETKTFTVTNNGNATVDNYAVILEDVKTYYNQSFTDENNTPIAAGTQVAFERPEDFEINVTCKITASPTAANIGKDCTGYNGTLPLMESETLDETYITNGILLTNSIEVGETQTYSVVLKYKEANTDQSNDMNKGLQGKLNIIDMNNTVDITGTIENATGVDAIVTNSIRRESQINSDGSYKIVGLEADVHSIKKKSRETETEIGKISIVKGKEAGVGTTDYNGTTIKQITITDASREATVDINATTNLIEVDDKVIDNVAWEKAKEGTLLYALKRDNEVKEPLTMPGKIASGNKLEEVVENNVSLSISDSDYSYVMFASDYTKKANYYEMKNVERGLYKNYKNSLKDKYLIKYAEGPDENYSVGDIIDNALTIYKVTDVTSTGVIADKLSFEPSKIDEAILSSTVDDYGTSYYFRGDVKNNFVTFSGKCWRIVRVQGNGTIKLILADSKHICGPDVSSNADGTYSGYNINNNSAFINDIKYAFSSNPENGPYQNLDYKTGYIPNLLNKWITGGSYQYKLDYTSGELNSTFETNISLSDQNKLAITEWCSDNTFIKEPVYENNINGYTYGPAFRITSLEASPSLKCNFTDAEGRKSDKIVSNIGLLSLDEAAFAGYTNKNIYSFKNYLNYNVNENYYTISVGWAENEDQTYQSLLYLNDSQNFTSGMAYDGYDTAKIRPVIALKNNVTINAGGNGTQSNPYVIGDNLAN